MAEVLNLNNEVVKMRKEVKKIRVLTIRRLTRHIAKLKAKKGTTEAIVKNHKRAQRLLEEIHAMKAVKLDQITKLALGKEINFEVVCKKPNSTVRDRAIARLATHPLLKTKITAIKAAVKAFKVARQKPSGAASEEQRSEEQLSKEQCEKTKHSSSIDHSKTVKQAEDQDKIKVKVKPGTDMGEKQIGATKQKEMANDKEQCALGNFPIKDSEQPKLLYQTEMAVSPETNKHLEASLSSPVDELDNDASESAESGTEKDYFDDSTEERFYNQSSGSDDSDSNDDFFIGKVKRTKKKGATDISLPTTQEEVGRILQKNSKDSQSGLVKDANTKDNFQSLKVAKLESAFYHSLSNSKASKNIKRTKRDQLPPKKATVYGKNQPQKQMSKCFNLKPRPEEKPLHPSWEASRKRREQVSQLTAFQGKKIKFED